MSRLQNSLSENTGTLVTHPTNPSEHDRHYVNELTDAGKFALDFRKYATSRFALSLKHIRSLSYGLAVLTENDFVMMMANEYSKANDFMGGWGV